MKKIHVVLILSLGYMLSGCGAVQVRDYLPSESNTIHLKSLGTQLNVNKFTAKKSDSSIMCRIAGPVETPNGEPFETYIENALISELKRAGMFSKESPISIDGYLIDTDASSGMSDGHWTFEIKISSGDKEGFIVKHSREFSGSFIGATACRQDMPDAFRPTVSELISIIIHHPEFELLLKNNI